MSEFKKFSTEKWVGTGLLIFVLAAACTAVFDGANPPDYQRVQPIFDSEAQKLGIALGESIKSTFRQAKEQAIDFSDKEQIEALAYKNSLAELERAGLVSEEEVLENAAPGSVKAAAAKQKPLSESQKKVMQEIEAAVQNSRSYLEFTDKLANINNGLALTVPAKEQLGLQRAIAALYYTMDAINDLVAEGVLKGTAEKTQRSTQIQKAGFGSVFSILPAQIFGKAQQKQERDWAFRYAKKKLMWNDNRANQFADAYLYRFKKSSFDRDIAILGAINDLANGDQSWWDCFKNTFSWKKSWDQSILGCFNRRLICRSQRHAYRWRHFIRSIYIGSSI